MKVSRRSRIGILGVVMTLVLFLLVGCSSDKPSTEAKKSEQTAPKTGEQKAPAEKTLELKLSHSFPTTSLSHKYYDFLAKALEEESKGSIKVKVFPAESLVKEGESADALKKGNVDITQFQAGYVSNIIKEMMLLEIPGLYKGSNLPKLNDATYGAIDTIMQKWGAKYLGPFPIDTGVFIGNTPVKSLADLKGKKVRVAGKWSGEAVKAWGGSPVAIPIGDVPTALERKTVDYVSTSWIAANGLKLQEVAKTITFTPMPEVFAGVMMNLDVWKSLSKDQQAAVERAVKRYLEFGRETGAKAKKEYIDALGPKAYMMSEAEGQPFMKATMDLAKQQESTFGPDGEALMKALKTLQ